jgi:DNA invertase Pin-like site-specific DNA recombinase
MTTFDKNNIVEEAFSKVELVAAYVRVSTQEQKLHGLSLDAQKKKLTDYASKNNMKIVGWYVDEGVSGRKLIKNRPELQRMIQDAENGLFSRIVFIRLDRFFRSVAEYHECMKRITPVVWTTTDEEYDLTTANGRMLVNMKLTIAEMEADMTGERINAVNDYKLTTGQPLTGSQPYGWTIAIDSNTGRKKIVRDKDVEEIVEAVIEHFLNHQSKRKTTIFANAKFQAGVNYKTVTSLLKNTYLYGSYRGNPNYCESYIDKVTFDRIQDILQRNVKVNTQKRAYLFSGLIRCPKCGSLLKGCTQSKKRPNGGHIFYKRYRCAKRQLNSKCDFEKSVSENVLERLLLANIEQYMEDAKCRSYTIEEADKIKIPVHNIEDIHEQIDRLNYSWQTSKIRKVEQYEKQYNELMAKLEEAEAEQKEVIVKDFSKIEAILSGGWKEIYNALDDEHKRSFWRSFIQSIEISWTTEKKVITEVKFF